MKKSGMMFFALLLLCALQVPAQEHGSVVTGSPQWDKLKSLVGEWEGQFTEGGEKMTTHISVRLTGDGSAVMHWMDAGTPHEMITMFHMDKTDLLATHYCAGHNQPRMRAVPSGPAGQIFFEFKDGTNIRPGDGYMKQLTLTFVDADHHNETWSYDSNGKVTSGTFTLTRVKPAK
jgi:YD repeat-containing protein